MDQQEADEPSASAETHPPAGSRRRSSWRLAVPLVFVLTGLLFAASGLSAGGGDLRPVGADLADLVRERTDRVETKRDRVVEVRDEVEQLSGEVDTDTVEEQRRVSERLRPDAGFTDVAGPGLRVELTDAPRDVDEPGLDPNLLVVHQQDIQAFVNALWAGGADAVTLQGQRLISTTGIKCVGNTVVLDGVPYSPPYVIEAVGDVGDLQQALSDSPTVRTYREYVVRYRLGLGVETRNRVESPAYEGEVDLQHASVAD
ncbi:DUF881 domain-containing protein [Solicola sp. PLA-1-18]|uniref:DUF881 domain-containing protein n=1 Tax=Solicola sp. PLA-1-18 TaxID=3380532 RepID=UPI003B8186B4